MNSLELFPHLDHLLNSADLTELRQKVDPVYRIQWILVPELGNHQLQEEIFRKILVSERCGPGRVRA
jgi:hypothetical protein